jgi:DNA polymerase
MLPDQRQESLEALAQTIRACTACPLHQGRIQAVPGSGAAHANIMFIGEAPGQSEDEKGLPFVGRSGQYLNKMLALIGLNRQDVFIANVIKCRPPDNRDPLPDEIAACKAFLDRQIEIINPLVIATLGRFSMARYFPNGKITQIHGQAKIEGGRIYYPLFHPAAVLRNMGLEPLMQDDFRRLAQLIEQVQHGELDLGQAAEVVMPSAPQSDSKPNQLSMF